MIKDALNFLRLQTQDIKHFDKYSIPSIILIFVLFEVIAYLVDGVPIESPIEILGNLGVTIFTFLFFIYWIFRKVKTLSFILVCKFFGVMNIGLSIALIILQTIALALGTTLDNIYMALAILIFIIFITGISTSKAIGVSKAYALSGVTLSILLLVIIYIIYLMIEMMFLNI